MMSDLLSCNIFRWNRPKTGCLCIKLVFLYMNVYSIFNVDIANDTTFDFKERMLVSIVIKIIQEACKGC